MISAELAHNPYLLTTAIRFNGCEPKVNSAVEKFEGQPLVSWVQEVPRIFHDEMNGYDFDLLFKGTKSDYLKLTETFESQGIGYDLVRTTHTGAYESVNAKRQEILTLAVD